MTLFHSMPVLRLSQCLAEFPRGQHWLGEKSVELWIDIDSIKWWTSINCQHTYVSWLETVPREKQTSRQDG